MTDFETYISGMKRENPVFDFFLLFSRFEYALIKSGYVRKKRICEDCKKVSNIVETDWDKLAKEIDKEIDKDFWKKLTDGNTYVYFNLITNPPKKLIIDKKNIAVPEERSSLLSGGKDELDSNIKLFEAVRRVRNNLFHGGKWRNGPIDEPVRNEPLIKECIAVICDVLDICKDASEKNTIYEVFHSKPDE